MTENTYGDMGLPPAGYPPVPGQPGSWTRGYDPVVSPPPTTGGWTPAPAPNPVYAPSPTPAWTPTRSAPDTPAWDAPPPARSAPAPSPAYNQDWSAPVASAGPSRATPDPWSAAPAPAPARSAAPAPSWPQTPDWNAAPQAPSRGVAEMTVPAPQAAWDAVPSDTKRRWDPLADDAPVADDAWQGNDYTADATGYEAWSNDEYNTADPVVPDQEYAVDDDVYYQDA
ncbi:MAG: hypothetical protein FWD80_06750, partial [Propionibacteriaceae bacterium]|nr:hypothetical protein [Propionibacteriaceae bacterium]